MLIKLADGSLIEQAKMRQPTEQNLLRKNYPLSKTSQAECLCDSEMKLPLKIFYKRASDTFGVKKMPGQDCQLHKPGCKFRTEPKTHTTKAKRSLTVAIPERGKTQVTDSKHLREILNALWDVIDLREIENIEHDCSWKIIKDCLKKESLFLKINNHPLSEWLTVLMPKSLDHLIELEFPFGRLLLGELFSFGKAKEGSYYLKLKGASNSIYLSENRYHQLLKREQNLIERVRDIPNERVIVLAAVIDTETGGSIKASSLAVREVDKHTFKTISKGER